ncbi:MAG: T9SS type A sorting domain-containing protein [Bacteroidetes bacterium]|nr:T9SS type A sorting domain-containing protein [Bacteroidota bacterium]
MKLRIETGHCGKVVVKKVVNVIPECSCRESSIGERKDSRLEHAGMTKGCGFLGQSLCAMVFTLLFLSSSAFAQYATKWMDIGSFQSWYSNAGCEYEEQRVLVQQDGDRWPAIYPNQDMEAAKGLWIGVRNWKDASGTVWPFKVVHFGPRYDGDASEFVPLAFTTTDRFPLPQVTVDGSPSYNIPPDVDNVNPSLKEDRLIYDSVLTSIGLTMVRKILGFGQQYHDNYVIYDYTFINTSNQPLDSLRIFYQYRYAVCAETRYVIGRNAAGWGIGTDCDTRGDGLNPSSTFFGSDVLTNQPPNKDNDIRAQYSWLGNFNNPSYGSFSLTGMPGLSVAGAPPSDNIGGPIWVQSAAQPGPPATDTTGRLGAAQFIGVATLHADNSATDTTDDPAEPTTTCYVSSDDPLNSQNSQFNSTKMQLEYQLMSIGHGVGWINSSVSWQGQRLADLTGLGGDPSRGTTGGLSVANGYGPYNLAPGQRIHIVMAEGAAGLSREATIRIGREFKLGKITAAQKDDSVYTGRDSLFQTFRRALANYHSGYDIPQPPAPPSLFTVTSGGNKIALSWTPPAPGGPKLTGFKIYRAQGLVDSAYTLLYQCGPNVTSYDDQSAIRGFDYYYYIVSVGDPADNNGAGDTPAGVALESSRYYTQTYDPAKLLRPGVSQPVKVVFQIDSTHSKSITTLPTYAVYTSGANIFTVQLASLSFLDSIKTKAIAKIDTLPSGEIDTTYKYIYSYTGTIRCTGTASPPSIGQLVLSSAQGPDTLYYSINQNQETRASLSDVIRVVPNPYNLGSNPNLLRYVGEPNQIGFLNIPPVCTIKIYTELGQLIKTIQHANGSGDEYWNLTTSSNQIVVSGVYIVVFQTPTGQTAIKKFVVIR